MPALKNTRHEAFAQHRAKGDTIDAAYVAAGYKPNRGNAGRLNANDDVASRISQLTEAAAALTIVTKAWIIERLVVNVQRCITPGEAHNPAAVNRALELLGKEQRMFIDRRLLGVRRIEDMSEEEILEFLGGDPDAPGGGEAQGNPAAKDT